MKDWVQGLALVCLTSISCLALYLSPEVGKEIALTCAGAIGGALSMKAYLAMQTPAAPEPQK